MVKRLMGRWWFWGALPLAAVVLLLVAFLRRVLPLPLKIVAQDSMPGEHLVVLFGDSITEGQTSSNYVDVLAQRMEREGYRFMNAGIGGDTAYNLLNRLRPVVKSQPESVVIMLGTNDMQAYLRGGYLQPIIQRMKKLPQAMTLELYSDTMRRVVLALQKDTSAHIALCSIPVLGEDLDSLPNRSVRLFNGALKDLADELGVAYLPVYETMEQFLRTHQRESGVAFDESRAGAMMMSAMWDHNIRERSWDDVSAHYGLLLTTDTIHFNSRGAEIIADLIEGWLHARAAWPP
jgi:lysophospholipase L1-like esterase